MTDSFLDNAGGFTPVSHILAQEVGLVCAAVYGAVWRKCQMEEGACRASLDMLGSDINLDRATVMRSIKKLCELGYLTDQTPGRRNAPHTYTLSKSVAECNSTSVVMRNSPKESVAEENKSVAHNNSSIGDATQEDKTVAESHLKIESSSLESYPNKESLQDSSPNGEEGDKPPPLPVEPKSVNVEYTPFMREFLTAFNAKRFKNDTQAKTIAGLTSRFGEPKLRDLIEWAANKGMGLGDAVASINSALTKPKPQKNGANHGTYQRSNKQTKGQLTGHDSKLRETIDYQTRERVLPDGTRIPLVNDTT